MRRTHAWVGVVIGGVAAGVVTLGPPSPSGPRLERLDAPQFSNGVVRAVPARAARRQIPTNVVVNDPAKDTDGIVQSELSLHVSGDDLILAWNDSEGFYTASSFTGYGTSSDRGETWTDGGALPADAQVLAFGDPSIVATPSGRWLIASIGGTSSGGTAIHRGVFEMGSFVLSDQLTYAPTGIFHDKEYMEVDPASGRVHMAWQSNQRVWYAASDDEGLTWSTPVELAFDAGANGPYPVIGIDGEVYVTWVDPILSSPAVVSLRHSADGGLTFDPEVEVLTTQAAAGTPPLCFNRGANLLMPSCDVDRSSGPHRGRLYLAITDGAANRTDAWLRHSDDEGQTWSAPIRLNDNANAADTEQFWPHVRVSPTDGRILVGWYDRRHDEGDAGLCDFYAAMSVDGGAYWGPNRRVSDLSVSWCDVPADIQPNFGDYVDVTIDDRSSFFAWADAREGTPDAIFARIDDRQTLSATLTRAPRATGTGSGVVWTIPDVAELSIPAPPPADRYAELLITAIAMAIFASPVDADALFGLAGEDLSGSLLLQSPAGNVSGTVSASRTGPHDLGIDVSATSDAIDGIHFLAPWSIALTATGDGPGAANVGGQATVLTTGGPLAFDLSGSLAFGDGGAALTGTHTYTVQVDVTPGSPLVVGTRTRVETDATVGVDAGDVLLANAIPRVRLDAHPSPLRTSSVIRYEVARSVTGAIRVHDVTGRLVRTLVEGRFEAGSAEIVFDGRDGSGRVLPTGAYFVRFTNDVQTLNRKLLVLR